MLIFYSIFVMFFVFLFGISVGSFLNVVIWRLPLEKSLVKPPSHCPKCGNKLKWYHNIPILSYIFLLGKCAFCKTPITLRYPTIEFINGLAWLLSYIYFGISIEFAISIILFSDLLAIFMIDLDHQIIPDSLNVLILLIGLSTAWFRFGSDGLIKAGIGMVGGFLLFLGVGYLGKKMFKRDALGGGDVKMLGAFGSIIGFMGVLETVFLSALIGVIGGIILLAMNKIDKKERVLPYGPYLAIAGFISFLFRSPFMRFYLESLGVEQETMAFILRYLM